MTKPKRYAHNSTLSAPSKPMARFNAEKRARRMSEDRVYGTHHAWIKRHPCDLRDWADPACGFYKDRPGMEGHHWHTVGSGGEDRYNQSPLCPVHHDAVHALGSVSAACDHFRRDFRSMAAEHTDRYDAELAARGPSVETGEQTK